MAELANVLDINPVMISKWKTEFLENLNTTFEKTDDNDSKELDTKELYAIIGQFKVENEF